MQPTVDTTAEYKVQGSNEAAPGRKKPLQNKNPSVLRSAASMSVGTLLSRVLGLARDTALAAMFPRMITDAYVVAFRLPNLFRRILGEGSLAASFVPIFVGLLEHRAGLSKDEAARQAQQFSNSIFTLLTGLTALLSVLGVLFMDPIMSVLVSGEGYQSVPGKFELTVQMGQIMFSFLFLVMTYAYLSSVLNAYKNFFIPAMAPAGFNLLLVIFTFLPAFHFEGDQLAWGVIAGGALQLALVVVPLVRSGAMPTLTRHILGPGVFLFFRNFFPSLIGMSVLQILALMNVMFASRLPQGAHSYIYLADRLLEFPQSLLSVSLGVALLPTLSEFWARGEKTKMVEVSKKHVRLLLFMSLPSAVGLFVLAQPIVEVVYMRGSFTLQDAAVTAQVLQIYAFVLVFAGIHRVIVPNFYAMKNTWLPAVLAAVCVVAHYFVATWAVDAYGIVGLTGATAFTGFLNLVLLLVCFRVYFGGIGLFAMLKTSLHLVPALVCMAAFAFYAYGGLQPFFTRIPAMVIAIGGAAVIFFAVNHLVRHPESKDFLRLLRR